MKFPVFSLLTGNLASQRRVRSRLPPPAASQLRTVFLTFGAQTPKAGPARTSAALFGHADKPAIEVQ